MLVELANSHSLLASSWITYKNKSFSVNIFLLFVSGPHLWRIIVWLATEEMYLTMTTLMYSDIKFLTQVKFTKENGKIIFYGLNTQPTFILSNGLYSKIYIVLYYCYPLTKGEKITPKLNLSIYPIENLVCQTRI